ncbi:MAG TPA: hypothetical protein DHV51_00180 [Opitutae bacterium]|nr:hypothetical protein [Opitutae bacterium]
MAGLEEISHKIGCKDLSYDGVSYGINDEHYLVGPMGTPVVGYMHDLNYFLPKYKVTVNDFGNLIYSLVNPNWSLIDESSLSEIYLQMNPWVICKDGLGGTLEVDSDVYKYYTDDDVIRLAPKLESFAIDTRGNVIFLFSDGVACNPYCIETKSSMTRLQAAHRIDNEGFLIDQDGKRMRGQVYYSEDVLPQYRVSLTSDKGLVYTRVNEENTGILSKKGDICIAFEYVFAYGGECKGGSLVVDDPNVWCYYAGHEIQEMAPAMNDFEIDKDGTVRILLTDGSVIPVGRIAKN